MNQYVRIGSFLTMAVLGGFLCLSAMAAEPAPVEVKTIVAQSDAENLVLTIELSGPVEPKIFPLGLKSDRPRVVVDFPGTTGRGLPHKLESPTPNAKAIRIGVHFDPSPLVRVVIDLDPGRLYRVQQWFRRDVNRYILVLSPKQNQ